MKNKQIEKIIKEFDNNFIFRGKEGRYRIEEMNRAKTTVEIISWLRTALTTISREAREEEREKIIKEYGHEN